TTMPFWTFNPLSTERTMTDPIRTVSTTISIPHRRFRPTTTCGPTASCDRKVCENERANKHRHDRVRFYGPGAFERLSAGQPVLQARSAAGAEGLLCPEGRQNQVVCRKLGL